MTVRPSNHPTRMVGVAPPLQSSGCGLHDWRVDQTDRPQRIAVIGAGISGLVSAWLLKRAGHDVSIFEASTRTGGRIRTLRDRFTNGLSAEAGAMRIPGHHRQTLWLAERFGLSLVPYRNECGHALTYINGKRFALNALPPDGRALGFAVDRSERGQSARSLFEAAIVRYVRSTCALPDFDLSHVRATGERHPETRCKVYVTLDRLSLGQFLRQAAGLSGAAADYISAFLSFEAHQTSSMAAILSDDRELNASSQFWQISGGMDALAAAFLKSRSPHVARSGATGGLPRSWPDAPDLADDILYNARVVELLKHPKGVRIRFENPITRRLDESVRFDRVIVSAPFSALRHVRWNGLASIRKQRAIRRLHYDNACKIFLEFEDAFWLKRGSMREPITGGHSITDLAVRAIHYPTDMLVDEHAGRAVLLASYTWAGDSLRWTALCEDDRIRFALRDIAEVHGLRPRALEKVCVAGVSQSWADRDFASGAFAMFEPHQSTDLFADVWRPEGCVHYCGEHTSKRHGWIEGAIESAVRVAREICESIAMGTVQRACARSKSFCGELVHGELSLEAG